MAFAVTAVVSAIEIGTVAAALTAIAEVGTLMTVVGVVTKSKELTKVGGALALVGGIGSLANAGLTSLTGAAAEGAAGAAAGGAAEAAEAGWADLANDAVTGINANGIAPMAFDGASAAASGSAATMPGLSAANSLDGYLSKGSGIIGNAAGTTGEAASGVSGLVPDAAGKVAEGTASPFLNDYGLPANAATDKVLGVVGPEGIAGLATPSDGLMATLKSKGGAAWDALGGLGKAEVLKSVLAMPGGIQNQKNIEDQIAIQQQKANQTSYGSAVPQFGIINKAKG